MKKRFIFGALAVFASTVLFVPQGQAFSGTWLEGKLTEGPWQEDGFSRIRINGVRYTIMKDTPVQLVSTTNGVTVKSLAVLSQMRAGDSLLVQRSGNRIYGIEINR